MTQPRGFPNWEELYRGDGVEQLPWYCPTLDGDLAKALDDHGIASGRFLDLGTGPGTQAIALAGRGFEVTATDVSTTAIDYASRKAKERGVSVKFLTDDVMATQLAAPFDAILDRGCFHVLDPGHRPQYVATMHRLLGPSGWLFLKTFSHRQTGEMGPHRFAPDDIRRIFAGGGFDVIDIIDTAFEGQLDPGPKALFSTLRRG